MRAEIKIIWLNKLRSGELTQGQGQLKTFDGEYCCLGVLCEAAVEAGIISPAVWDDDSYDYNGESGVLPSSVMNWAGLSTTNPIIATPDELLDSPRFGCETSLAELNDIAGYTFAQIANVIEEHL